MNAHLFFLLDIFTMITLEYESVLIDVNKKIFTKYLDILQYCGKK